MTVINTMAFNEKQGGMVTDSQSSGEIRKYDIAEKLSSYVSKEQSAVLVGGSGFSSVLEEAKRELRRRYSPEASFSVKDIAYGLGEILTEIGRDIIDRDMMGRFGFGSREFISGRLSDGTAIGPHLIGPAGEAYEGKESSIRGKKSNMFLVLGRNANNGVELYGIPMGERPIFVAQPYASIGSGSDESDRVLSSFLKNLPRKERRKIEPVSGMTALIRATNNSSEFNQGVGGVPTITYFDEGDVVELGEEESLLATEIVKVIDGGLIGQKQGKAALERLIIGREDYKKIDEEFLVGSPKANEVIRFLRGYR